MNVSSPYNPTTITHGKFDVNHTTDAAFVYNPQSLFTPWPYLLCSIALSLVLSLWALIKVERTFSAIRKIYVPSRLELAKWKGRKNLDILDMDAQDIRKRMGDEPETVFWLADG